MTNYEKYRAEIDEMAKEKARCSEIAEFIGFHCTANRTCTDCLRRVMAWASEEYTEQPKSPLVKARELEQQAAALKQQALEERKKASRLSNR